jgi:DNA repair exonuclease SbcCD ATPase subunit
MNIIGLKTENYKRLSAVEITPDGALVVIGGNNGQGKSSVLDSIERALGGVGEDAMPVRKGEDKARIVLNLGELVVTRTFTAAGGTSLVVKNADGVAQMSPQTILDKLTGKLAFDPLEFSRQKAKEQAETLSQLVGLDFAKIDAERQLKFDQRTAVNREEKALKAQLDAMPKHEGVPTTEIDAGSIIAEQQVAAGKNAENARVRANAEKWTTHVATKTALRDGVKGRIADIEKEIAELNEQLSESKSDLEKAAVALGEAIEGQKKAQATAAALVDVDLSGFAAKATEVAATNRKVRENAQRSAVVASYKAKSDASAKLTEEIEKLDADKRRQQNAAKWPIDGLALDTAQGVTLNGIPFKQTSSADQLKVSLAIGLALNPKLKIILIRDGSLLDTDSMKMVSEMATKAGAQVWIERVGVGDPTAVIIEDGHVKLTA